MSIIKTRKIIKLFYILILFILIPFFVSYIYKENSKISTTWNIIFPFATPLKEPKEVLFKYSTRGGFHGDGTEINLLDISNWNMKEVMDNFHVKKFFSSHKEIERYCKDNLYFSEEDNQILSQKLSEVFSENSIWFEYSKENTESVLAIYYNPNNQKCLLLVSCI